MFLVWTSTAWSGDEGLVNGPPDPFLLLSKLVQEDEFWAHLHCSCSPSLYFYLLSSQCTIFKLIISFLRSSAAL
jgi:hypothetical protein